MCDRKGCKRKAVKTISVKWTFIMTDPYSLCEDCLRSAMVVICRAGYEIEKERVDEI